MIKDVGAALDYALITAGWLMIIDGILGAYGSAGAAGFPYASLGLIITGWGLFENDDIMFTFAVPVVLAVYAFFRAAVRHSAEKRRNKIRRRRRAQQKV